MTTLLPSGWVLSYDAILLALLYLARRAWRSPLVSMNIPRGWLWGVLLLISGLIQRSDYQLAHYLDGWAPDGWPLDGWPMVMEGISTAIVPIVPVSMPAIVPGIVPGIMPVIVPIYVAWQLGRWSASSPPLAGSDPRQATERATEQATERAIERAIELERSLALLRATLDATEDGILAVDLSGKITVCNHRFLELYDVPPTIASLDDRALLPILCAQIKEPERFRQQVEQEYLQPTTECYGMLEFRDGRVYERHSNPQYIGDQVVGRVINYRDITRSRQAEVALKRSESKNRALLQTIPDLMIHTNRDGIYLDLFVAKNFQTIRPEGDLRGLHLTDVIPPDIAAQRLHYVHQALETGEMQCYEYLLEVNGISQYEEARIAVIDEDEVLVIVRDISDRHRMMQELTRSEATKRALLETIPDMIHRMQRDGTYLDFFPASNFKMLMPFDTLQGRNVFEILPPALAAERMQYVERAIQTGETQCYDYAIEIDGVVQYEEARISLINNDELLVIVRDISDRKQAEAALREARDHLELRVQERTQELSNVNASLQSEIAERLAVQRRLEQLTLDLQRSNQELEQFAYIASHDLQEPLRTITSYTQLLAKRYQGQLDERADRYIHFIVDGATRMQQLIRDLLTYSKVGRREPKCQPTDCNGIVQQVIHDLQQAIAENSCSIHYSTLPTVMAEASQLSLLFQNLIGNAIKYRRDLAPMVEISAIPCDRHWLFRIQDNGIGIEPQYRDRIFEIFQRLHTSDEYSGTGLGLAICKKIVERYGGSIGVESAPGKGSLFYFTIPSENGNGSLGDRSLGDRSLGDRSLGDRSLGNVF